MPRQQRYRIDIYLTVFRCMSSIFISEPGCPLNSWLAYLKQGAIPGAIPTHLTIAIRFQSRDSQAALSRLRSRCHITLTSAVTPLT